MSGSIIEILPFKEGHCQIGMTYLASSGVCDRAYFNSPTGMAYVFDGADHGNIEQEEFQNQFFPSFEVSYNQEIQNCNFKSVEEARLWVQRKVNELAQSFFSCKTYMRGNSALPRDYPGAFTLVQTLKKGSNRFLLTAQMDDCFIIVSNSILLSGNQMGLGGEKSPKEGHSPQVLVRKIKKSAEIFLCTDGIGDFLSEKLLLKIIKKNRDRSTLLDEFKQAICSTTPEKRGKTVFGFQAKEYDPEQPSFCDDIAVVSIKI